MSGPSPTCVAVIDDDDSARRALSRLLRADGMQPVSYPSAEAFLADTHRPQFDCLVLDVKLGGMSGIELHRRLRGAGPCPPVVFVTAHDEPDSREEAEATGCVAYFSKTAPGQDVLNAIRRAADRKKDSHA